MPLGIKPTVDFAFKKIFGSPENSLALIGLLNAILKLDQPIQSVEILNPFNHQEFADDKLIVLDIRARDESGRVINIEMQVSVSAGLLQRLTYYACSLYTDQLGAGDQYSCLCPALSICLLSKPSFRGLGSAASPLSNSSMCPAAAVFPTESKYTRWNCRSIIWTKTRFPESPAIEQWAFFLLYADRYEADQLRELLPAVEFQRAIDVIETIAEKDEDKVMYDQREKAQRDYEWAISSAREQGIEQGLAQGIEQGIEKGAIAGQIQMLQSQLGEPQTSMTELRTRDGAELDSLLSSLQSRLRGRDA